MADRPRPPVPATLDRAALERVLARAAELQGTASDPTEEFSEQQLIELGREVGLSPQSLRQALAEERTRSEVPTTSGLAATLLGPAGARASRVVPGSAGDVMAAIDSWMQQRELLTIKRRFAERASWERNRDVFVGVRRALRVGGRDYALSHADEVSATVIAIDASSAHVTLEADFLAHRRRAVMQVAGAGVAGAAAGGVLLVLGVMAAAAAAPVVALPVIAAAADRGWRRHMVTRSQLALDQILDRLEQGELTRPESQSLLGSLIGATLSPRRPR